MHQAWRVAWDAFRGTPCQERAEPGHICSSVNQCSFVCNGSSSVCLSSGNLHACAMGWCTRGPPTIATCSVTRRLVGVGRFESESSRRGPDGSQFSRQTNIAQRGDTGHVTRAIEGWPAVEALLHVHSSANSSSERAATHEWLVLTLVRLVAAQGFASAVTVSASVQRRAAPVPACGPRCAQMSVQASPQPLLSFRHASASSLSPTMDWVPTPVRIRPRPQSLSVGNSPVSNRWDKQLVAESPSPRTFNPLDRLAISAWPAPSHTSAVVSEWLATCPSPRAQPPVAPLSLATASAADRWMNSGVTPVAKILPTASRTRALLEVGWELDVVLRRLVFSKSREVYQEQLDLHNEVTGVAASGDKDSVPKEDGAGDQAAKLRLRRLHAHRRRQTDASRILSGATQDDDLSGTPRTVARAKGTALPGGRGRRGKRTREQRRYNVGLNSRDSILGPTREWLMALAGELWIVLGSETHAAYAVREHCLVVLYSCTTSVRLFQDDKACVTTVVPYVHALARCLPAIRDLPMFGLSTRAYYAAENVFRAMCLDPVIRARMCELAPTLAAPRGVVVGKEKWTHIKKGTK